LLSPRAGAPRGEAGIDPPTLATGAVGGIGLVTVLRLVQVGRRKMKEEEDRAADPH